MRGRPSFSGGSMSQPPSLAVRLSAAITAYKRTNVDFILRPRVRDYKQIRTAYVRHIPLQRKMRTGVFVALLVAPVLEFEVFLRR